MADEPVHETSDSIAVIEEKRLLDRTLAEVRDRMIGRLHEVSRRIEKTKHAMNLALVIRTHPLAATGIGFVVGALLGLGHAKHAGA
jgi:ElaB/YqjD/DUF883 family membrane-anchored ribosome-binding protein